MVAFGIPRSHCRLYVLACVLGQWIRFASTTSCPVRLLDIAPEAGTNDPADFSGAFRLVDAGVEYLARQRSPLYIVPALGVYRGGKSSLLNRLMGLEAPYHGGFGVGHQQQTFTRGIDICVENVDGVGSVVWMDTEGLFSSEDAHGSYGPKIFSLALLFSSTVLLNSIKVLNEQFFSFFSEQQQVARVLRRGLADQGLRPDRLLPSNLSVTWVLQQPVQYDSKSAASRHQLDSFLSLPGDESRARVRESFQHRVHEVAMASHDARNWARLDTVPDKELSPEYIDSVKRLRSNILGALQDARPMQAASAATQLRLYVDVVRTQNFSGVLALQAFEEAEIGTLCGEFERVATSLIGEMPSQSVLMAFEEAHSSIEANRTSVIEAFHLSFEWSKRLGQCLRIKESEILQRNAEVVWSNWQKAAGSVAENGGCFFLGELAVLLKDYESDYGGVFSSDVKARAVDYASALQRARLVECVRLRDILFPFVPWLAWPFFSIYLRDNMITGCISMSLHIIVLVGLYAMLQFFGQLPQYADIDYPLLRMHPPLLNLLMQAPPRVPWAFIARWFGFLGMARSLWKLLQCFVTKARPAGHGQTVGQLINLELKLNNLAKRSEADFKRELASAALDAANSLERGDSRAAARMLVKGLCTVPEVVNGDTTLSAIVDEQCGQRVRQLLDGLSFPPRETKQCRLFTSQITHNLDNLVTKRRWALLLQESMEVLEKISVAWETTSCHTSPQTTLSPLRQRQQDIYATSTSASSSPHTPHEMKRPGGLDRESDSLYSTITEDRDDVFGVEEEDVAGHDSEAEDSDADQNIRKHWTFAGKREDAMRKLEEERQVCAQLAGAKCLTDIAMWDWRQCVFALAQTTAVLLGCFLAAGLLATAARAGLLPTAAPTL